MVPAQRRCPGLRLQARSSLGFLPSDLHRSSDLTGRGGGHRAAPSGLATGQKTSTGVPGGLLATPLPRLLAAPRKCSLHRCHTAMGGLEESSVSS